LSVAQSMVAEPAGCTPQLQPVHLPPDHDPAVIYWPSCVMVKRCTGCCGHDSLSCQPTSRVMTAVEVMKARYSGADQFDFEGTVAMPVEEHEACDCFVYGTGNGM